MGAVMRIDKFLCDMQIGSRSHVKELIKNGTVTVNGTIITKPDFKIDEQTDTIMYMGNKLIYQQLHYYMLHKPAGVVTATKDSRDKTVMDLLPEVLGKDLFPVGRLDKDTEGLLLITNDGVLSHDLLSPKKHVAKTYYIECTGTITTDRLLQLEAGLDIGDEKLTLPAKAKLLSTSSDSDKMECYTLELTIIEGRFHQVKRMITAIGGSVTYLKRLSMGTLTLGTLPKGQYRELIEPEIQNLKSLQKSSTISLSNY